MKGSATSTVITFSICLLVANAQLNGYQLLQRSKMKDDVSRTMLDIEGHPEIVEEHKLYHIANILKNIDLSNATDDDCTKDMFALVNSVVKLVSDVRTKQPLVLDDFDKNVTLVVLDSSAKPQSGILRGHFTFYGLYAQCTTTIHYKGKDGREFKGDYFRMFLDVKFRDYRNKNETDVCAEGVGKQWAIDVCLPRTCSSERLLHMIRDALDEKIHKAPVCKILNVNDNVVKTKPGTYIVAAIMLLIIGICFLAGIYDYFFHHLFKDAPFTKGLGFKIFMAFSMYKNISEIFSTAGAKKAGQIGPIHCIRFFSMVWVICGHMLSLFLYYGTNPLDVRDETTHIMTEILSNAYFAVDSFFFLSGLLLAFIWYVADFKKNKKRAMSPIAWTMFYVHRLIRLSPPYYILILFYTFVFLPWLKDMPIYMSNPNKDPCLENWWINLLYLTNFVRYKEQCYLVAWYLSTDLQIYLFAPLILVPLAMGTVPGLISAAVIFLASTGANIGTIYHYYFPPDDYAMGWQDPRMFEKTDLDHYTMLVYDAPWIRCQIYIIGMLVGWFLQMRKSLRINRILNLVLWFFSFVLMGTAVLGLHRWTNGWHMPVFWRAMYSAFSRPAWGLGLSWIVISSFYGYGGPINDFMSWTIWVPLGRLTYCSYLIHICIVLYFMGIDKTGLVWSNMTDTMLSYVLPSVAVTYFFAIFWSSWFEVSLGKVEGLLIGGIRRPPPKIQPIADVNVETPKGDNFQTTVVPPVNGNGAPKDNWS